jgi:hypothetical protein
VHLEAKDAAGNAASLDRTVTYEEPAKPPGPTPPDSSRGVDPALMAGVALAAVIIIAALYILFRRKIATASENKDGESGSPPERSGP